MAAQALACCRAVSVTAPVFPSQVRCRPLEDPVAGYAPDSVIPMKERKKMDRFIEFALVAAHEALAQAGWHPDSEVEQQRTATVIASGLAVLAPLQKLCVSRIPVDLAGCRHSLRHPFWRTWRLDRFPSVMVSKGRWVHP